MRKATVYFIALFLMAGIIPVLYAQQDAVQSNLRKEIVKVNYIDAVSAYRILMPYKSKNGKLQLMRENNMLIIEDIPEITEKILSILKEIDIKPRELQFAVDLILGSMSERPTDKDAASADYPDRRIKSDPLIKELSKLLTYESFQRLDSTLINVQDNNRSTQMLGGAGMSFRLDLRPRYIKEEKGDFIRLELQLLSNRYKLDGSPLSLMLIETTLSLRSGERAVVGVSKLNGGDKALILILSGVVKK